MSLITYNPATNKIVHKTRVDFTKRSIQPPIHVVQYDKSMPVVAVSLYKNGEPFSLVDAYGSLANVSVQLRWGKKDHTYVIKSVIGANGRGTIVYFEVDQQMVFFEGHSYPILEISYVDGGTTISAGSSEIPFIIDRNPVQQGDIESSSEYIDLQAAVNNASSSATSAANSATAAAGSAATASNKLTEVIAAGNQAKTEINEEGERVRESLPEDYTELSDDVQKLKADKINTYTKTETDTAIQTAINSAILTALNTAV